MKLQTLMLALTVALAAGTTSNAFAHSEHEHAKPTSTAPAATAASASGIVQSVDPKARTVTIAHGAVASLKWPAMTMSFKTGDVDLTSVKAGDHVSFEFTVSGMDATISKIEVH
jgi:Cu/Ag efflux protein CusF